MGRARKPKPKPEAEPEVAEERPLQEWDRQDGETDTAWQAFKTYRDLGPARSIAGACAELSKSRSTLQAWSGKNKWVVRARAWDRYADQQQQERDIAERGLFTVKMWEDHAQVSRKIWKRAEELLLGGDERGAKQAKKLIEEASPAVLLRMVEIGMEREARARLRMSGRGLDPNDAKKITDAMIDIALRYVPPESVGAYLHEIETMGDT